MNAGVKYVAYAAGLAMVVAPAAKGCAPPNAGGSAGQVVSMCDYAPDSRPSGKLGLDSHQAANARAVIEVAAGRGLPRRAAVIGIATTLQESRLRTGAVGDNGTAFGIFQQRPVSGWGTRATATNARVAAGKFYDRLEKVRGWKTRPLTSAAQAVQRSAFPYAYADDEDDAERIVNIITWRSCK
ncbi:hypothetical protein [Nonomuraea sp. NPDC023979]|uniref:hypothetical protein n=1 Tax=Nonomuraea sp. NPDC023979 TaxID=3154796 RepID=UPI0034058CA3